MDFQIIILLISFIVTVILGLVIIPILKKLKVGQNERDDGPQSHLQKQGTPTMGGVIMLVSIVITTIIAFIYYSSMPEVSGKLIPFLILSFGFGLIGFLDDYNKLILHNTKGLSPTLKMAGLLVISVIFAIYQIQFSKMGTDIFIPIVNTYLTLPGIAYIPFIILVMLATTNAVNLTDGIDGLAASITTIIIATIMAISIMLGILEVTVFSCILCGATVGFLLFNLNKAKVFMGDTGSLFLGGIIAGLTIYLKMPILLLVLAFVPVIETMSVMLQVVYFKKTGNRLFKMAPIHHHFELCGWKENKVVVVFSIVTIISCVIGFLLV